MTTDRTTDDLRWVSVARLSVSELPAAGDVGGAYIFRRAGTEEVLYVGSTSSLRRRLLGNYVGGIGGATTQRLHAELLADAFTSVEVAWVVTPTFRAAEVELMEQYAAAHDGARPPWNRATRRLRSIEGKSRRRRRGMVIGPDDG